MKIGEKIKKFVLICNQLKKKEKKKTNLNKKGSQRKNNG